MVGSSPWLRKFVIPAEAKKQMAWELRLMEFRFGNLFPDPRNIAADLKGRHVPNAHMNKRPLETKEIRH